MSTDAEGSIIAALQREMEAQQAKKKPSWVKFAILNKRKIKS